jgi:hypothetical protein
MPSFMDAGYIEDYFSLMGEDELQGDETGKEFLRLFEEYKGTFDDWEIRWPFMPASSMRQELTRRGIMNKLLHLIEYREKGEFPAHVINRLRNAKAP